LKNNSKIYLDIETTSLDADSGIIVAIGYAIDDADPQITVLKSHADEKNIISMIFQKIKHETLVTYNGIKFDIPFLIARGLKYGLYLPDIKMIDLYPWAKAYLKLQSRRFHEICLFYDIPHEDISGKEINELFIKTISGDNTAIVRIIDHLTQDLKALRIFYQKTSPLLVNYPVPEWESRS